MSVVAGRIIKPSDYQHSTRKLATTTKNFFLKFFAAHNFLDFLNSSTNKRPFSITASPNIFLPPSHHYYFAPF